MTVKADGPSGRAKIQSDDARHALSLIHYLRTIGYRAWIEDTGGNEIEEKALKESSTGALKRWHARESNKLTRI